jgi:hypothetical protein
MFRTIHRPSPGAQNCNCSLWFYLLFGFRLLRWLSHRSGRQPKTYLKPEAAVTVFELLLMGGVSPETRWAIKNNGIINSTAKSHLVGSFYEIYITIHGSVNIKIIRLAVCEHLALFNKEINKNDLLLAVGSLYLKKKSLTPINNVEVLPAIGCSPIRVTFIVTTLLTYLFHVAIKLLTEI